MFFSCKKTDHVEPVYVPKNVEYKFMNYENHYPIWQAKGSSTCSVAFHQSGCSYWYNSKQSQRYNYKNLSKTSFDLVWSTQNRDKVEIIERSYGISNYPKDGDIFATYSVLNDSMIQVNYRFKEWTTKINTISKDSIFPKYLYSSLYN